RCCSFRPSPACRANTNCAHTVSRHRTTKTRRHKESRHQRLLDAGFLCVFVSLWLLIPSEIRGRCRVITVPIFDHSIRAFQKSEKASIGAVSKMMTSRFDGIARFDVVLRDTYSLEPVAARCFKGPHLGLALVVLHLDIDPGMRHDEVNFFDNALDVHERVFIVAMRMMRPRRQSERNRTDYGNTDTQFKS